MSIRVLFLSAQSYAFCEASAYGAYSFSEMMEENTGASFEINDTLALERRDTKDDWM